MKRLITDSTGTDVRRQEWPLPAWLNELPEGERDAARIRFFLNLAAAYAAEKGTLTALSVLVGHDASIANVARSRGSVSPKLAIKIEELLGRELFPRELFNPIFEVVE